MANKMMSPEELVEKYPNASDVQLVKAGSLLTFEALKSKVLEFYFEEEYMEKDFDVLVRNLKIEDL